MKDRSKEITPNLKLTKCVQYDRLTTHTLELAQTMKETGLPQLYRSFVNADGEQTFFEVTPRFLWGMHRIRDRAFKDYVSSPPQQKAA